jgi:succinate dehydrogenase/fumarate reductase flavoprotein subunit
MPVHSIHERRPAQHYDLIVIGSGAAGLSSALSAAQQGLKVCVLEVSEYIGGTSAWSGGWMWIPQNHLAKAAGVADSREQVLTYLRSVANGRQLDPRIDTFLDNAPKMAKHYEESSALAFLPGNVVPDMQDLPGALKGGRSLYPAPYDARELGDALKYLRPPRDILSFWHMGIGSFELRDFYDVLRKPKSTWYVTKRITVHIKDMLVHRRTMLLQNGNALVARLLRSVLDLDVELLTQVKIVELTSSDARVDGVRLSDGQTIATGAVLSAAGGFPHSEKLQKELFKPENGAQHFSAAVLENRGEIIEKARELGASVSTGFANAAAWAPVSRVPQGTGTLANFPHLLERNKPGIIAVGPDGKRFTNEANCYHQFQQGLFSTYQSEHPFSWLITDAKAFRRWGLGWAKPAPVPYGAALKSGYLRRAGTLTELASLIGLPAQTLVQTVERFNQFATQGVDADFGRGESAYNRFSSGDESEPNPSLGGLTQGPYFAVKLESGSLGTFAGLQTNARTQVLNSEGQHIAGLYAVGNEAASIFNGDYPSGGITLGPAMTFGYIAGRAVADDLKPNAKSRGVTMKYYEMITLKTVIFGAGKMADGIQAFLNEEGEKGQLLGAWFSDIGDLNEVYLLRGFESMDDLVAERTRIRMSADPFNGGDLLLNYSCDSYVPLDFMPPLEPGEYGKVYEIRTYQPTLNGLAPTIEKWREAVPVREQYSHLTCAMYSLDGPTRFTQIWPYESANARAEARAKSVADGNWPPAGGPSFLRPEMKSTLAIPMAFSPLK